MMREREMVNVNQCTTCGVDQSISDEDIDDVLATAFEGGINYWVMGMVEVPHFPKGCGFASEVVSKGEVVYILAENFGIGGLKRYRLDKERIIKGILMQARHRGESVRDWIEMHDSIEADRAVQYAIFDEVIYAW
jgi:hypothetical protein